MIRQSGSGSGRRQVAGLALALALAACGGDGTGPEEEVVPASLVGTWSASPSCVPECGFTLESVANPADSVNITAFAGIATEVSMTRGGSFVMRTRPGPDTATAAQVRVAGSTLIVTDAGGQVDTVDWAVTGAFLDLRFRRHFRVFDFTGDGVMDPAVARGRFRR